MSDELAQFRREFAAMKKLLDEVPDNPTTPEDVARLGQVRRFMYDERAAPTRVLARPVADLYYLDGYTQREIGELIGITDQAVSVNVLAPHGPSEYVAVRQVEGGRYELERLTVSPDRAGTSYKRLRAMRDEGWRVAPAALGFDPESVDAAVLWERLGKMGSRA